MPEDKKELARKQEFNTALSILTNRFMGLMEHDFREAGIEFDDYSKRCSSHE